MFVVNGRVAVVHARACVFVAKVLVIMVDAEAVRDLLARHQLSIGHECLSWAAEPFVVGSVQVVGISEVGVIELRCGLGDITPAGPNLGQAGQPFLP